MLFPRETTKKSSDIIKDIRSRLWLSQTGRAEKLGVSFVTVNRWEKGRCEPSQITLIAIKRMRAHNIDYLQFEGNHIITFNELVTLYHGPKYDIVGDFVSTSREYCY